MRAIVLAAGRGSRLEHMTEARPKCLVTVLEKPLLFWQREALSGAGLPDIAVVRGYRKEEIAFAGLTYFDNERWAETNMVGSLLCADAWLSEHECIISYADLMYPREVVERLQRATADIAITYDPNWLALWSERFDDPLCDSETFALNECGDLIEIGQRAKQVSEIQGQYMGLLKFTPAGWQRIKQFLAELEPNIVDRLDMTSLLSRLIADGVKIQAISIEQDWWYEIDNVHDLALVSQKLAEGVPK